MWSIPCQTTCRLKSQKRLMKDRPSFPFERENTGVSEKVRNRIPEDGKCLNRYWNPASSIPPRSRLHAISRDPHCLLQYDAETCPFSPLRRSRRKVRVVSASVSASPSVSQKDTLSFKFYGSYLWLKYHLWQFPSAKLQKWYSFIAKGCYWGPKLQAKSWAESECTWILSHRKLSLFKDVRFLDTSHTAQVSRPQSGGPPGFLPHPDHSKGLGSCSPCSAGWTPFLIPGRKAGGLLPPSFSDSYRLAGHLIKD